MFSFFKRKKKQETVETASEPVQTPTTETVAEPETPSVEINVNVSDVEPLTEAQQQAVDEHIEDNIVSQLVSDVMTDHEDVSEQTDETVILTPTAVEESYTAPIEETAALNSSDVAETLKSGDSIATVTDPVAPAVPAVSEPPQEEEKLSWAARLKKGLSKSRNQMAKSLAGVFGGGKIDEDLYEELETVLITSDMGIEATEYLMKDVRKRVSLRGLKDGNELRGALKDAIYDLIKPLQEPLHIPESNQPFVIMLAGINGAGKTTSIGKLAKYFQSQGKSVLLAAGDTFRAAAREQLQEWGARNGVTVISQTTGDSAAVCFDAVEAAKARHIDIVLADTAGRLPTQLHLMEEIKKVKRVLQKSIPDAPHEIMVVLDANIGQNAVNQVVAFDDALGVTGLIVTKLDGTAKGGILAALASNRPIPVRYIGVGESIDDLRPFDARAFVDALFE
ncbi:signal recognition particle-docking protein FtsY [Neisseria montereyensis]|uniref:Signal recognition particle receptor FtsY n=1 Tax=Neisseria montereyensis TaxID=2973938 RepID=A0ABT2FEP8_9NEIS|nr:signal recognition particle-docking protein FtsY [Neisseria montereyensis]MCS4533985.1 signal recognition particle-docking protein FtsY [Neisseria montereyensis]